ncbi:CU044_2847 family protein [Rhizohabitans arisaemae]|uniref:CU044_2847 family protein n=1 Tax=Rhizohabitans arisaemae TaxID=2720610 RepID=UPI0024B09DC7|nr:CU044_2847 family protein [Rhizohabitans arisaemae]
MAELVPVESDGIRFWVEVSEGPGIQTVGLGDAFTFDGVRDAVLAVGSELQAVWEKVRPSEAEVEFGVKVTAKTGKLSGLLVEGGGDATLKVKLVWRRDQAPGPSVVQVQGAGSGAEGEREGEGEGTGETGGDDG